MSDQFVLLWSKAKNAIDIKPLEAYLSANREAYKDDRTDGDFIPVYVGARGLVAACAGHCSATLMGREIEAVEQAVGLAPERHSTCENLREAEPL